MATAFQTLAIKFTGVRVATTATQVTAGTAAAVTTTTVGLLFPTHG